MRKVVYTALTNGYDGLMQITCINPKYDYICFSNDFAETKIGIWNIRKIPFETSDSQLLSRFPKLQAYKVLPEYDMSIYIDANVDITSNRVYQKADDFYKSGILLAGLKHQLRQCLYRESLEVMVRGVEKNHKKIISQMQKFTAAGFPFDYGMYEANVIYRAHNNPLIKKQCDEWWYWFQNYSRRDQLSYSFSLWENNIPFNYLLPENEWSRNSSDLVCVRHPKKHSLAKKIWDHFKEHQMAKVIVPVLFPFYKLYLKSSAK